MVLLGSKIKELRTKYRFTQSELAELVGVTKSSIASYENDSSQPSYSVLIKLARTFNVSTDFLLLGKTDNTLRIDNLKDDQIRIIELLISSFQQSNSAENDSNQKQNPILYHHTTVVQALFHDSYPYLDRSLSTYMRNIYQSTASTYSFLVKPIDSLCIISTILISSTHRRFKLCRSGAPQKIITQGFRRKSKNQAIFH